MSIEEVLLKTVRELAPQRQQEILDHALRLRVAQAIESKDLHGLAAGLGPVPTAEDIDEVHREMWRNFPREDV